ncbi:MAG: exodeoxyribonuclease V subunit beta [bacterium]
MNRFDLVHSPIEGRNLIEASAGTGKTFTITGIYLRLLLEKHLSVDEILVVTFTIAATEELRDRIRSKIRELLDAFDAGESDDPVLNGMLTKNNDSQTARILLTNALRCFDEAAIFTIHGFCQRILQDKAFECGSLFTTDLVSDQKNLLQEVVDDFWRIHIYPASLPFMSYIKTKKNEGWNPADLALFAVRYINRPDLRIIPHTHLSDTKDSEEICASLFTEAKTMWSRERCAVETLLLESRGVKRNMYKVKNIPEWCKELDHYFYSGNLFPRPKHFKKFGTEELIKAKTKGNEVPAHPFFDACDRLQDALTALCSVYDNHLIAFKRECLSFVRKELSERKRKQNIRSFDDLLSGVQAALCGQEGSSLAQALRTQYKAALIDEFQDTDPVQYAIFNTIYPDKRSVLFLIGDPKQAIYSFRGADIFAYIKAGKDIHTQYTLGTNWRSEPALIEAINTLFTHTPNPFLFEEISFHPVRPAHTGKQNEFVIDGSPDKNPFKVWFMRREGDESAIKKTYAQKKIAWAVAGEIGRLLQAGKERRIMIKRRPVEPGDIAILVRSNTQARTMQEVLGRYGIPSVLYSSESLFVSREATQFLTILSAMADPVNESKIKAAMVTDIIGLSGTTLASLIDDELQWEEWLGKFRDYNQLWTLKGFMTMARSFMTREGVRSTLLSYQDGERRLTNLLHCLEVLHQASLENKCGIEGLLKWFVRKIEEHPETEEYQIRLETDEKAVKLITIHKSKGLEYSIVFCPYCWGRSTIDKGSTIDFHDPENEHRATINLGSDEDGVTKALAEKEILAENLRLLYVALTRAKYRCYLVWGMFNKAETSAPAYLLHYEQLDQSADEITNTARRMKSIDDESIIGQLEALAQRSSGTIEITSLPSQSAKPYLASDLSLSRPSCRTFTGHIPDNWRIASFSYLTLRAPEQLSMPGWDEGILPDTETHSSEDSDPTMFDFPKGARAGTCLHTILEEIDYRCNDPDATKNIICEQLIAAGFDENWTLPVHAMVKDLLSLHLFGESEEFSLNTLSSQDRVNEMEFYFPLKLIRSGDLGRLFSYGKDSGLSQNFLVLLDKLDFSPSCGLLKGYIDLTFHYKGKYYLIDWKSNYLGHQIEDYNRGAMHFMMEQEYYILQLHLYTLALHKYLSQRIPDYSYSTHFGSAFYIFLRGIDLSRGPSFGIYRARPSEDLINHLCAHLSRSGKADENVKKDIK